MTRKIFIHSSELDEGGYPPGCPFNSRRAGKTRAMADSFGLLDGADRAVIAPERLSRAEMEWFHTADYLDALRDAGAGEIGPDRALAAGLGTVDCPVFKGMYDFTALAGGGTLTAARLMAEGEADIAFNPSGGFHHAQQDHAAGFCYLNDVVMAIEAFTRKGLRVAYVDIDAHHGDGVQNAFYHRSDVLTCSLHESGATLFPGTGFTEEIGDGEGRGYSVNIPLPVGTYDAVYLSAFRSAVWPLVKAFGPDVLVLELGMDTLAGDPLAHLHLTNNTPTEIVETLVEHNTPLLVVGGGGYHVENTVRGWTLAWSVLGGDHSHVEELTAGMGGVMLENTDWFGGLRDRVLLSDAGRRDEIDAEVAHAVDRIRATVFPVHGL